MIITLNEEMLLLNRAPSYTTSHGLGIEKPDDVRGDDDEFDAYRKRMMLAYRFRPNPLVRIIIHRSSRKICL